MIFDQGAMLRCAMALRTPIRSPARLTPMEANSSSVIPTTRDAVTSSVSMTAKTRSIEAGDEPTVAMAARRSSAVTVRAGVAGGSRPTAARAAWSAGRPGAAVTRVDACAGPRRLSARRATNGVARVTRASLKDKPVGWAGAGTVWVRLRLCRVVGGGESWEDDVLSGPGSADTALELRLPTRVSDAVGRLSKWTLFGGLVSLTSFWPSNCTKSSRGRTLVSWPQHVPRHRQSISGKVRTGGAGHAPRARRERTMAAVQVV